MIAAALAATGASGLQEALIGRIAGAVGAPPDEVLSSGAFSAASWALAPPGVLDRTRRLAYVGSVSEIPREPRFDTLSGLRGRFALAAWAPDALLLARGYFGGRPLFYSIDRDRRCVVACSRLAPLVAALARRPSLDVDVLGALVVGGTSADASATPYIEVKRLRAGEVLEIRADGVTRHGSLKLPIEPRDDRSSAEDFAFEIRTLLLRAVARSAADSRRVAVLAGGGVDSSAVLAAAVALGRGATPREVDAIALDFAGPGDDRPHLRALANDLGIQPLRIRPRECAPLVREVMVLDAAPMTWPTIAWEVHFGRLARERGADVVLTGVGGDDLFDGDPRILAEQAWHGDPIGAITAAARLRVPWDAPPLRRVSDFVVRPLVSRIVAPRVPAALREWRNARAYRIRPWATQRLRDVVKSAAARRASHRVAGRVASLAMADQYLEVCGGRGRVEAASGCTHQDPFLDEELVRCVSRIPEALLLHGDRMRGLLRLAIRGLVPETVRLRADKASFEPAILELVQASGGVESLRELASVRELARLGLVEPRVFAASFDEFARSSGTNASWLTIWPVLVVEAFVRRHEVAPKPPADLDCRAKAR